MAKLRTSDENQNSILYALLTHLSKVPELNIDMVDFDYLQINLDGDLDNIAYDTAIVKLDSLQLLLSRMIVERNKNDIEQT